jgi:hypothetical protein
MAAFLHRQLGKLSFSSRWMWLQTHLIAQLLQTAHQLCLQLLLTFLLEVIRSFFLIGFPRLHHLVIDHQNTVPDCHRRSFAPAPFTQASILRPQPGTCWSVLLHVPPARGQPSRTDSLGGFVRSDVCQHFHDCPGQSGSQPTRWFCNSFFVWPPPNGACDFHRTPLSGEAFRDGGFPSPRWMLS